MTELRRLTLRRGFPGDTMKALAASTRLTRSKVEGVRAGWTAMAGCSELLELDMEPSSTT